MKMNNKYIDLNQFCCNQNGRVSWKNSVGVVANFMFNDSMHTIQILEYIDCRHIKVRIDDTFEKIVQSNDIVTLSFEKILHQPSYFYDVGSVIDNIEIIELTKKSQKIERYYQKAYKCRCLKDGYIFIMSEYDLKRGRRCPLCANKVVVKGFNDIATTNPEMVQYLKNIEDAYLYASQSNKQIDVRCPICGFTKNMPIYSLYQNGFSCDMCSDGISYPNKFAHELFRQLFEQYLAYEYEYGPDWAKGYLYDNYVKLLDNHEIIVEMDGAYHYIDKWKNNDKEKDLLAQNHNIEVIRINCNYPTIVERFEYIKNNVMNALQKYFDLSSIDWDKCNECGMSSVVAEVVKYYNANPTMPLRDMALYFNICADTLRSYLCLGEELGLCQYKRVDTERHYRSKPIAVYDSSLNLVGIYKTSKQIENIFSELKFSKSSVFRAAQYNRPYKGHLFKFVTFDEYRRYVDIK